MLHHLLPKQTPSYLYIISAVVDARGNLINFREIVNACSGSLTVSKSLIHSSEGEEASKNFMN